MRIGFIADIHARGKDIWNWAPRLKKAIEIMNTESADILILLGDTFDSPSGGDKYAPVWDVMEGLSILKEFNKPIYCIAGNHDFSRDERNLDVLYLLEQMHPNLGVIRTPTISVEFDDNLKIGFAPWMWKTKTGNVADILPVGKYDVLAGHFGVAGRIMSNNVIAPHEGNINECQIPNVRYFALGHYHKYQPMGRHGEYVGALRQTSFCDVGNVDVCTIWDSKNGTHQQHSVGHPSHIQYSVYCLDDLYALEPSNAPNPSVYCRFICHFPKSDLGSSRLAAMENENTEFIFVEPRSERRVREKVQFQGVTNEYLIDKWASAMTPAIDPKPITEMLREVVR